MRVLISGGAGFIGSRTAESLVGAGHQVRVLDALMPPVHASRSFPERLRELGVDCVVGDVRDRDAWDRALDDVDAVFHAAAYQDYLTDFSTFFTTNTASTALLYEALVARGQTPHRVLIASSQAVYGEGAYRCPACPEATLQWPGARTRQQLDRQNWALPCGACGHPLDPQWTDEDVARPHNSYAMSKYGQEMVALQLGARYEIPTVALRYSIVQGSGQSFRNPYSGILRIFAQRLAFGRRPRCYEDGGQLRDYVSIHDVIRANLMAMDDVAMIGQVFNVGGGRRITVRDYAHLMADCMNTDLEPEVPGVYRLGDTRHALSSIERLGARGWSPRVALAEVIREYVGWAVGQPGFVDATQDADAHMHAVGALRHTSAPPDGNHGEPRRRRDDP